MADFDICVLHQEEKGGGWFSRYYYRFVVTELSASGDFSYLYESEWIVSKYSFSGAPNDEYAKQELKNHQVVSSLIAEGWKRSSIKGRSEEVLIRGTTILPDRILPISERIKIVNKIIQSNERNNAVTSLLAALEKIRDSDPPVSSAPSGVEIADQIQARLEALDILFKVKKIITEEEYIAKRQEIMKLL